MDPAKSLFQYNCQNWDHFADNPGSEVNDITQSKDGYIWVGTNVGLVRYDGAEFKVFALDLPPGQGQGVDKISLAPDGKLWISSGGGAFGRFDGKTFSLLGNPDQNGEDAGGHSILAASDGTVWTGSAAGWIRWTDGQPAEPLAGEQPRSVRGLSEDAMGRVWLGTGGHPLSYWAEGRVDSLSDPELEKLEVRSVVNDRSGDLWVATSAGLFRYDSNLHRKEILLPNLHVNALLVDSHGLLWAGTNGSGLGRYEGGQFTFLRKVDGLVGDHITALCEDKEGSIWVGSSDGLSQITDLRFPIFTEKEGFMVASLAVAASNAGGIWVATVDGATHFDGHKVTNYTGSSLFPNKYLRRIFVARNGQVYFCDGSRNLIILSADGTAVSHPNPDWIEAFTEDNVSVIANVGSKLVRIIDGKIQTFAFDGAPPVIDWIYALCAARDGTIWVGTSQGLMQVKDGKFHIWTTTGGLPSDRIDFVMQDIDGSIWAGSPSGILRAKDGVITRITDEDGLSDARVYAVVADNLGYFWLDSGRGLLRIARTNLNAFADGKVKRVICQTFDDLESLKLTARADQAYSACKSTDGRIWFPNPHGVVMVDPAHYYTNKVPPRVTIQDVRIQGQELPDQTLARLRTNAGAVEFTFSALSYIEPNRVRVRYQLEGFDKTWIDAGVSRSASYGSLPEGRYSFVVKAANADGVWNTAGGRFDLEMSPPIYERGWFYAVGVVAAILLVFGLYGWKARQVRGRQRELQAQNELLEGKVAQRTDELARSLSLLRATLDSTPDGILAIQMSDDMASWNSQFVQMWGIPSAVLDHRAGAPILAFLATQVLEPAAFRMGIEAFRTAPDAESFEVMELKGGKFFERFCKPQQLDGRNSGIVLNFRDVTDRKRIECALRASEQSLKALFDQAAVGVAQVDFETGRFVQINAHFCEILGRSQEEMRQLTFASIIHPEEIEQHLSKMLQMKGGAFRESTRDERYLRKDGTDVWVNLTVSAMWARGERPDFVIAVALDITKRKQLEDQFRQSQKMDAIGTLAGGIAHDFNNILTIISGYTELAQMELKNCPQVQEHLGAVKVAAGRATDLVRQILTFSRQQPLERRPISLVPIVNETLKMLRATIPTTIEFENFTDPKAPTVFADPTQIHQILMNLGTNAWHAMKDHSGLFQIRLDRYVVNAANAAAQPQLRTGVYARLSVSDTGCGMDQATLGRIFEPFFTTKPAGEGTGLGLAVVHGIMDDHEGAIKATSRPGEGTIFELFFPEHSGAAVIAEEEENPVPRGNGERILVVDDEVLLVQLVEQTLSVLGYKVETATEPEVALAMVRAHPKRYALVFTDQTMPGMTGLSLASKIQSIEPSLPIVLMTGNNLSLTSERIEAAGICQLLLKPTSLHALASAAIAAIHREPAVKT